MVISAIEKLKNRQSICTIKERFHEENSSFQFCQVNPMEVMKQIESLDNSKSNSGGISTSKLRDTKRIVCPYLTDCIKSAILDCKFPDELKNADISPIFKGHDPMSKVNFRPISVLSSTSKVYERILKEQMSHYLKDKVNNILCGFGEGYSSQNTQFRVVQKWKKSLDNSGVVGTILMGLSKAYDCLFHDLLIAKLAAYGFSISSLFLVHDYLTNRHQRVKIFSTKSNPQKILVGVPQGSVLGPLLLNIVINDLFHCNMSSEICNFADDNIICACRNDIHEIAMVLENDFRKLLEWFTCNGMVVNPKKFQLMFLGLKRKQKLRININEVKIPAKKHVKLLGVETDNKLSLIGT